MPQYKLMHAGLHPIGDLMRPNYLRLMLSYCVAAASAFLCGARGHVQVELVHPSTYVSLFQHRCGLVMVVCLCWVAVEMLLFAAAPDDLAADRWPTRR